MSECKKAWKYLKGSEKDFAGAHAGATHKYVHKELGHPVYTANPEIIKEVLFNLVAVREPITECTFQDGVVFDAPIGMPLNEFKCRQQSLNANYSDMLLNGIPVGEFSAKADVEVVKCDPDKVDIAKEFLPKGYPENGQINHKCGELKIDGEMHDATINKYTRDCKGVQVDVYDVLQTFDVTNPALQHLIKKALCVGIRGHKTKQQDLQDIIDSAIRAKELESNK